MSGVGRDKEGHKIKSTESMVTVRLSDDVDAHMAHSLPSPTPTLMLVDEKSEEYVLADDGPMFLPERSESPVTADLTASRRSSVSIENGVDWAELEKTEGEHTKDQTAEEVGNTITRYLQRALSGIAQTSSNASQGTAFLLARLEQENKRLEKDPKALHIHPERPPSLAKLKHMMDHPDPNTLRYSMTPAPPLLTDLEV